MERRTHMAPGWPRDASGTAGAAGLTGWGPAADPRHRPQPAHAPFALAIDGFLNASAARNGSAQIDARMRLVDQTGAFGFEVIGSDSTFTTATLGTSAIIDEVLQFTTTITKSQDYLFLLGLDASASTFQQGTGNSGSANANFLNTAFLSFTADDTLTVTASDPAFLSGAAPAAPVPLPAGAVLMLSGLAALRLAKRKPARA